MQIELKCDCIVVNNCYVMAKSEYSGHVDNAKILPMGQKWEADKKVLDNYFINNNDRYWIINQKYVAGSWARRVAPDLELLVASLVPGDINVAVKDDNYVVISSPESVFQTHMFCEEGEGEMYKWFFESCVKHVRDNMELRSKTTGEKA